MDYLQCGFFHVSSNGLMLNIFCHWEQLNGSSPVRVLSCLFKWIDIEQLQSHWEQLNDLSLLWFLSSLFKVPNVGTFLVTLRAAEWFITSVGSFMSLQMA